MLKEDPNEISATALVAISQALTALTTNNSSTIPSGLPLPDQTNPPNFVPSNISIWINALWYSSFSLSIATAFMAMLAKDWCYSFKAKRTGHPYDQAHRRQRKWEMIRRWGMGAHRNSSIFDAFVFASILRRNVPPPTGSEPNRRNTGHRFVKRFSKEKDTTTNKNAEENTRPFMEKLANIVIMPFKLIKELAEIKSWSLKESKATI
ncbi:hypothetical protein RHS01_10238 [Rhizoctonia solani]|uniref:DUF6535 domain-containing protein n=1 Tax=Rhizoctonia solani TaxID=456999 RepID=A0A8H7M2N5_9AGAM|nr:hypothetical protein RHS01_10238 [Rhizoctonia solani]